MEILLATTNLHKIREYKEMFKPFPHIELTSLNSFKNYRQIEETGTTFKENAILKAEDAAKALNKWALADDSGLVVPALGGDPGVSSRRYAGPDATDKQNCQKLLNAMKHLGDQDRSAYFECCLSLASPEGLTKTFEGRCEGAIVKESKGSNGFGYDPLFVKEGYDKTFGELEEQIKNRISHRDKAFKRLLIFLESLKTQ